FLLAPDYQLASSLSFYLPGQPEVFCLGGSAGMTTNLGNQHDVWRPNPRLDPEVFRGRPAIVVDRGNAGSPFAQRATRIGLFDHAEPTIPIVIHQHGVAVAAWNVAICRNY